MTDNLDKLVNSFPQLREVLERRFRFGKNAIAILPAEFVQASPQAARLWCVARSLDHVDNGGNGCGIAKTSLDELAEWLQRSTRSVWRYLQEAKKLKFIHRHWWNGAELNIEYCSMKRIAKSLGLKAIGAVGMFPLQDIQHARAKAAEIQAEGLQRQSDYKKKEEWGKYARGQASASDLLARRSSSARVTGGDAFIARGKRLLYLGPHWRPFGGSQATIAQRLGVSVRTIQYRLSNSWRESHGLETIQKAQTAHQVYEECPKPFLMDLRRHLENFEQKYVFYGNRLFKVGCNLYSTSILLRGYRYRKYEIKSENILQNSAQDVPRLGCSMEVTQEILESQESVIFR